MEFLSKVCKRHNIVLVVMVAKRPESVRGDTQVLFGSAFVQPNQVDKRRSFVPLQAFTMAPTPPIKIRYMYAREAREESLLGLFLI